MQTNYILLILGPVGTLFSEYKACNVYIAATCADDVIAPIIRRALHHVTDISLHYGCIVGYAWKPLDQNSEVMEVEQFNWRYGAYFSELFYEKYLKMIVIKYFVGPCMRK
jgi:hypothetical protein